MVILGEEIFMRKFIHPHVRRTVHVETGMTYGVSFAGYDIRIKQQMHLNPGEFALASAYEYMEVPPDLVGFLHDKSTLARMGLFVGVGVVEPGWKGWLTLELKNQSATNIVLLAGQPIAQVVFHRIDGNVAGYDGRYQNQPNEPVGSKVELMYRKLQESKREV
jgi:dCTP deaminase